MNHFVRMVLYTDTVSCRLSMQHYSDLFRSNLELTDTFDKTIVTRHAAVRGAIENIGAGIKETKLIGSLQRRTRIQPRTEDPFDIDILVVLGEFQGWVPTGGITSDAAINYLMTSVEQSDRYSAKRPTSDAPTISLDFRDRTRVELVPGYVDKIGRGPEGNETAPAGRGYWVPTPGGGWQHADYDFDAGFIATMNSLSSGRLVPSIKMLKAARRLHFPALKSFALEILAAHIIPAAMAVSVDRNAPLNDGKLMKVFFGTAKDFLAEPISIPGSNSPAIQLPRAEADSLVRTFAAAVQHIDATEELTSERASADAWRILLGDAFPAVA